LSWVYSNNNENINQTINQDQVAKTKQTKDRGNKEEIDELETQIEDKAKAEVGNEGKVNTQHGRTTMGETRTDSNETMLVLNESNLTPDAFPVNNSPAYIGLISAALTVIAFFLSCTIFLMKQRGRNKIALLQKHTALLCTSSTPGITINTKDIKLSTPIVVNNLSQSRLSLKSKTAPNIDYKFGDASEHNASEKINKMPTEQYVKCEVSSSYKTEHFGTCRIVH